MARQNTSIGLFVLALGIANATAPGLADDPTQVEIIPFATSAFPYDGTIPANGRPFLDVIEGQRRGHRAPRGGVLWEDQAYADPRVLMVVPKGFDRAAPSSVVVFFHGNKSTLARDVVQRQHIPEQLAASRL